jgi:hypothetical protein
MSRDSGKRQGWKDVLDFMLQITGIIVNSCIYSTNVAERMLRIVLGLGNLPSAPYQVDKVS